MVRRRDALLSTDPFPSVFTLLVNHAKRRQRNTLHTLASALEGAMAFDEHTSGQARVRMAPRRPVFRFWSARKGRSDLNRIRRKA
jgi:hypothetical protein